MDKDLLKKIVVGGGAVVTSGALLTAGLAASPALGIMSFGYTSVGLLFGTAVAGNYKCIINQIIKSCMILMNKIYSKMSKKSKIVLFFLLGVTMYILPDPPANPPAPSRHNGVQLQLNHYSIHHHHHEHNIIQQRR